MIKIESLNKNFLIQFFLIGVIIFTGGAFLRPKIADIFQMRKKISEEKEKMAKLTQKEAFLESLDENELIVKTQFLLKILPSEKDVVFPLTTLRLLASQFNLRINSIQIDLGRDKSNIEQLSSIVFSLKFVGDRENIKDFIEKIKITYPLMKIESVTFSKEKENQLEGIISVKTFFLSLPKEIGKIEDPLSLLTPAEEKAYQKVSNFTSPLQNEFFPSVPAGKENPFSL